jgi:hypothetical protein
VIGPVVKLIRKVPIQVDIVRVGSADTTPVDLEVDLSDFFLSLIEAKKHKHTNPTKTIVERTVPYSIGRLLVLSTIIRQA